MSGSQKVGRRLPGEALGLEALQKLRRLGDFEYQFGQGKGKRSRVMVCDNDEEYRFILERIRANVAVFAQPL